MEHPLSVSLDTSADLNAIYRLFDEVPFAVAAFKGHDLIIEYVNQYTLTHLWQLCREDVIGKSLYDVRPDIQQLTRPIHEQVFLTGQRFQVTEAPLVIVTNGIPETRYFNSVIDPMFNASGEIIGQLATSIEVTEQVLSRKKIEESEVYFRKRDQLFRIALDGAEMGTFDYYPQTGVLEWSSKTKELFGLPADAPTTYEVFIQALHPDDRDRSAAATQEALNPASGGHYENEYRTIGINDGKLRWVRSKGKTSFDSHGNAIRMTGIAQDITARKEAEQQLSISEEKYRGLFESMDQGFCIVEVIFDEGNKPVDYIFLEVNPVFEKSTGLQLPIGKRATSLVPGENYWIEIYGKVAITGEPVHFTQSSEVLGRSFDIYAFRMGDDENRVAILFSDISERMESQKRLTESESRFRYLANQLELLVEERTKELQRSNEDLQQFAHVASHDLKEPVRKVMTFANRLKDELGSNRPEKIDKYISKIESSAARMYSMIDGVLLYSSLNALEQTAELIDLDELIESIESDLEVMMTSKEAKIVYHDLPTITASSILMHQLFYNLINNSLKFSRSEVQPVITVRHDVVTEEETRKFNLNTARTYVKIIIEDNGIGFGQEEATQIFGAFTRLHSKDKYEGTGLGLALCKKIVERHGGVIYADGKEQEYALFTVLLPQ